MGRSHFADYRNSNPKEYQVFSDNLWNGFVSVTKYVPIVNRFFSFTPADLSGVDPEVLNPRKIGRELGKVYKQANSDTQ